MMARTGIMRALNGPRGKRGRNDIHFWKICGLGVKSQNLARDDDANLLYGLRWFC